MMGMNTGTEQTGTDSAQSMDYNQMYAQMMNQMMMGNAGGNMGGNMNNQNQQ